MSFGLLAALATFGLIVSGAYVAGSNAGLAFADWPLFDGKLIAEGGRLQQVHFIHRLMAASVSLPLLALAAQSWRQRPRRAAVMAVVGSALVLYLTQVFVGASNIWFRLDPVVRAGHLAVATALWVTLVSISVISASPVRQPIRAAMPSLASRKA
jgi:heme A synthase